MGMTAKKATTLGAIASFCCCVICCGIPGLAGLLVIDDTIAQWPVVDGTVVSTRICEGFSSNSDSNSQPTYYVTYNYTIADGTLITAETEYCTNPYPKVGEIVPITYDPENPNIVLQEEITNILLIVTKVATGIGFGLGVVALCVTIVMCMQPDPPANPTTSYPATNQSDAYECHTNNQYANESSSVPVSGPAGDIPTPTATAVPMAPAVVYNGSSTPAPNGPVTYYK